MTRKILRLGGVVTPSPLPSVSLTDMDRAFANIPGLHTLVDPAYRVGSGARNLARPNDVLANATASGAAVGAFPGGAPAFDCTDETTAALVGSVNLDPTAWSVLAVHRLTAKVASSVHNIVGSQAAETPGPAVLRVGFIGDGAAARAWNEGLVVAAGQLISFAPTQNFVGRTAVSLWTYSGGRVRYFLDGTLRVEGDALDLTNERLAGQWSLLRYCRGLFGNIAVTSSDLSRPDLASHRQRVVDFLMEKYG